MKRLSRVISVSLGCCVAFFVGAQDFAQVQITRVAVTDNISMLQGSGGNIGLFIGEDGTFLIDDQFAPLTEKILAAIKEAGGDTPKFLLNTHHHGDHTGGNENLGRAGALIVSQDNVRRRLGGDSRLGPAALPVVTFGEDISFHINGDLVNAFHAPMAHTDGDVIVYFRDANVIHTGDLFFNGGFPFVDVSSGGSLTGLILAAEAMLEVANEDTRIIPGHGALAGRAELQKYHAMLQLSYRILEPYSDRGKSVEEVVAEKPLAHLENEWGGGFMSGDRFTELAYQSILNSEL